MLKENTELQSRNTNLLKKLADQEKSIKKYTSKLQRKTEEIQRLQKLVEKPRTAPVKVQALAVRSDIYAKDTCKDVPEDDEISGLKQEKKILQESLNVTTQQCSEFKKEIKKLNEQAKPYEIEYQTEREENDRLKAEIKQLQQRFETLSVKDEEVETVEFLQGRIRQLNEDLATLREHSKKQSHQVLRLRQQAELTQVIL